MKPHPQLSEPQITRLSPDDRGPANTDVAKLAALDLKKLARSDRVGLVAFAGSAFLECPLTLDYGVLLSFLDRVEIGMAGEFGHMTVVPSGNPCGCGNRGCRYPLAGAPAGFPVLDDGYKDDAVERLGAHRPAQTDRLRLMLVT